MTRQMMKQWTRRMNRSRICSCKTDLSRSISIKWCVTIQNSNYTATTSSITVHRNRIWIKSISHLMKAQRAITLRTAKTFHLPSASDQSWWVSITSETCLIVNKQLNSHTKMRSYASSNTTISRCQPPIIFTTKDKCLATRLAVLAKT